MVAQSWHPEIDEDDRRRPPPKRRRGGSGLLTALAALVVGLLLIAGGAGIAWYLGLFSAPWGVAQQAAEVPAAGPAQQQVALAAAANADVPQPTVLRREAMEDWIFACVQLPNSQEQRCGISQQLSHSETGATLFVWRITQDGRGGFVGEWETPTGLVVGRGIVLDAGTDQPIPIPFQACTQTGCIAVANLAPDFIEALNGAREASATVVPIGSQPVRLMLSVKGLAAGLAALGAETPQVPQMATQPAETETPAE